MVRRWIRFWAGVLPTRSTTPAIPPHPSPPGLRTTGYLLGYRSSGGGSPTRLCSLPAPPSSASGPGTTLTGRLCDRQRITAGPFESAACLEEEVAPHIPYGGTRFARIVGQHRRPPLSDCNRWARASRRTGADRPLRRRTVHSVRADLEERSTGYFAGQRPPGR